MIYPLFQSVLFVLYFSHLNFSIFKIKLNSDFIVIIQKHQK